MSTPNYHFFWNGPFSQWAESPFTEFGIEFNCAEQFMMAAKAKMFNDDEIYDLIMEAKMPNDQKRFGRKIANFDKSAWDAKAIEIVTLGNYNKFTQHAESGAALKEFEFNIFVEASPYDPVWGVGLKEDDPLIQDERNWKGTNWLGICINNAAELIRTAPEFSIQNLRDSVDWRK